MTPYAVLVVLHDSDRDLQQLLASLQRADPKPARIVVVDAGSSDGGPERARAAGCEVVLAGDVGFGAANNAGIAEITEPVTLLLNPDVVVDDPASLGLLVAHAGARDALHAPRLLNADGSIQDSAHLRPGSAQALVAALLPSRVLPRRLAPWRARTTRPVGWAIAAAIAARTDTLKRLGPFDASAFLFYEDLDLCLRAERMGIATVLHPAIALTHRGGHATGPAYGGEPHELLARRRRSVVLAALGPRAAMADDAAQAIGFLRSAAIRGLLRRGAGRPRAQLRALRRARAGGQGRRP